MLAEFHLDDYEDKNTTWAKVDTLGIKEIWVEEGTTSWCEWGGNWYVLKAGCGSKYWKRAS